MKFSSYCLLFFLTALAVFAALPSYALWFDKMPLGNVARVLSARFKTPVTIAANAAAPVTGDFSKMDLKQALAEAAKQSGLVVIQPGADVSAGYALVPPKQKAATDATAILAAATKRREELLRKRADLLDQAARPRQ